MPVMLAHVKPATLDPTGWMMSEKFDGCRAYWNGVTLASRSGRVIHAPEWFTASLPAFPVDGELYLGPGTLGRVSGLVRARQCDESAWKHVRYMLFDAPALAGGFASRIDQLKRWKQSATAPHVSIVDHVYCESRKHLAETFRTIRQRRGEGVVLRGAGSLYQQSRSWEMLKVRNRKFI